MIDETLPPPTILPENSPLNHDWTNALQQFGLHKPTPSAAIFNAAFIPNHENILVARAINTGESIKKGVPDRNFLLVCAMDPSSNVRRLNDLALPIIDKIVNWEDIRVWQSRDQITLGITAVIYNGGLYKPCSVLVAVEFKNGNLEVLGNPRVFENIAGKNVVPLEDGFICRLDGQPHTLHRYDRNGKLLHTIDFSKFNKIPWLSKKIGTTARPIDLADRRKVLLIHGIRGYSNGIDGTMKDDIYSLGIALLDENWQVLAVDSEPVIERSHYLENLRPEFDRDPHKEVVYLCDYQQDGDIITLPVNVGDRVTVFTHIRLSELLVRAENILLGQQSSPLSLFCVEINPAG